MTRRICLVLTAMISTGCTVGPDFVAPAPNTPPSWHDQAVNAPTQQNATITDAADPEPDWWTRFNDPELSSLMARATAGNFDLKIAVQKILESRANETSKASQGLPSLTGSASYTRQQTSLDNEKAQIGSALPASDTPKSAPPAYGIFQGALDASWELDLFGKVRRSVEAADAETEATIDDRNDSLVSLQAEVAQTYAQLRAAQASLATAKADIDAESELLALTKDRTAHGFTSDLDVRNAAAQLASSEAAAPQYSQQITTYMNSLAVLIGVPPGSLDAELATAKPIPSPALSALPIGLPSTLARRRPDIRAAEARLHEQTADVGAAIAALYPDISLTGEFGQQAQQLKGLTIGANNFYSFGPSISLPIFDGGKLQANIDQSKAEQLQAEFTYRKTVLSALKDIENALASYRTDQQRLQSLQIETDNNSAAVDIARDRYKHGLSNYLDVLTPQNTLIQSEQQLLTAQLSVTDDLVTLYKALGGGWQASFVHGTHATVAAFTAPASTQTVQLSDTKINGIDH